MLLKNATLAAIATVALAATATAALAGQTPVLGNKAFAPKGGGFGRAHPVSFFNGDDEDGYVGHIAWTHWGSPTADGTGRKLIFKPGGGYYSTMVTVKLRAHDLGTCPGSSRRAYRELDFRVPAKPGAKLGPWKSWTGGHSICSMP